MLQDDNSQTQTEVGKFGERRPVDRRLEFQELTREEIQMYKKCIQGSFLKIGLPLACLFEVYKTLMSKSTGTTPPESMNPPPTGGSLPKGINFKRGFSFLLNVVVASVFYMPVCYRNLYYFHWAKNKKMLEEAEETSKIQEGPVNVEPEDFSYPTHLLTNISDSMDSFSADFNSTKLIIDDTDKPEIPHTTYDELRLRSRQSRIPSSAQPSQQPGFPRSSTPLEPILSDPPPPPPPRRLKRNKYGDEME